MRTVGKSEDVTNGEFPDFKPVKVIDVLVPQSDSRAQSHLYCFTNT